MYKKAGIVGALWFLLTVNYLDRVAMSFAGPVIMKSLAITPAQFGIILSSFGLGYMLTQIPGGLLADRWGSKVLLVVGPLFWALLTGATGLVSALGAFVIVQFCFGVAEGLPASAAPKVTGDTFNSRERPIAFSIIRTGIPLGPALAGGIIGALVTDYGWRMMFFFMAAPAVAASLVNLLLIPRIKPLRTASEPTSAGTGDSFRKLLRSPGLWLLAIAQFCSDIAYWGFIGWMPSYLALARHINIKAIGMLGSIPYLFGLIGMLLAGWIGMKLERHRPMLFASCFLLTALSLFLTYNAGTLTLALAGLSATAFFLLGGSPLQGAILLDLAPERQRASFVGINSTAGQFGGLVAPAVIGYLVSATGTFAAGFGFMIAALCVGAPCMLYISRSIPRNLAAPDAVLVMSE